mgnify:CR=1 FL=1
MISDSQVQFLEIFGDRNHKWESQEDILKLSRFYLYDQVKVLESALDVLDRSTTRIQCFDSKTKEGDIIRSFWKVPGTRRDSDNPYVCTETGCNCVRYSELARAADTMLTPFCKHRIACYLATALDLVDYIQISEEEFAQQLASSSVVGIESANNIGRNKFTRAHYS